jgi:NAD(P)-dependent dehydrogenase (short-subunit alcohol dehydrogenase family)
VATVETNFFGVLRVTNAVLPGNAATGLWANRNISSVLGFLPAPYMGIYVASKHAGGSYTETLDHEVRRFGVRRTFGLNRLKRRPTSGGTPNFAKSLSMFTADERKRLTDVVQQSIGHGDDPRIVAEAVYQALTARVGRACVIPVGKGIAFSRLRRFVPPPACSTKVFANNFTLGLNLVNLPL